MQHVIAGAQRQGLISLLNVVSASQKCNLRE